MGSGYRGGYAPSTADAACSETKDPDKIYFFRSKLAHKELPMKIEIGDATLYCGDCVEVLRTLPDGSVDAVVTDPPYGLSFMGKRWDYDVPSEEVWRECLRVLKPGGHLLAFAGTRTQHRMAVRIEDAGFEIRDMIAWVYGSGFPKSKNLDGDWQGWGTALKPALEPITVARKPLVGTVAENVLAHGTGGLNVDGCRVAVDPADPVNSAIYHAKPSVAYGKFASKENGEARSMAPPQLGRWPANLIHDGSDEVVGLFPQATSGSWNGQATGRGSKHSGNWGKKDREFHWKGDSGSAARFFQQCKSDYNGAWQDQNPNQSSADTADQSSSLQSFLVATVQKAAAIWPSLAGILSNERKEPSIPVTLTESKAISETVMQAMASIESGFSQESQHERRTPCGSLARTVATRTQTGTTTITTSLCRSDGNAEAVTFTITPSNLDRGEAVSRLNYCAKASKADRGENHHPTVKPTDLMRYLCRLVTPPGGVVLDPFTGSGSTGKAALLEGFCFVGIEREAEYVEIARARIAAAIPEQNDLFA